MARFRREYAGYRGEVGFVGYILSGTNVCAYADALKKLAESSEGPRIREIATTQRIRDKHIARGSGRTSCRCTAALPSCRELHSEIGRGSLRGRRFVGNVLGPKMESQHLKMLARRIFPELGDRMRCQNAPQTAQYLAQWYLNDCDITY